MAVKIGSIKADLQREQEGDWVDIPDLPGVSLRTRSIHYGPFQMARDVLMQRFARQGKTGKIDPVERDCAFGRLYAEHLLVDWRGFVDDDGQAYEYTPERALQHLTDPAFRDLRRHVEYAALRVAESDVEVVEDVGEASASGSSGT